MRARQAILNASVADFHRFSGSSARTQPVVHCDGPWARQCAAKHHQSAVARGWQEPRDRADESGGQGRGLDAISAVQAYTEAKASDLQQR